MRMRIYLLFALSGLISAVTFLILIAYDESMSQYIWINITIGIVALGGLIMLSRKKRVLHG